MGDQCGCDPPKVWGLSTAGLSNIYLILVQDWLWPSLVYIHTVTLKVPSSSFPMSEKGWFSFPPPESVIAS